MLRGHSESVDEDEQGLDDLTMQGWRKVQTLDELTEKLGNLDTFQGDAGAECSLPGCVHNLRHLDIFHGSAGVKCVSLNSGHCIGNLDAFQGSAVAERSPHQPHKPDFDHRLRDVNVLQGAAALKCMSLDAGHQVGKLDALECSPSNSGPRLPDLNMLQKRCSRETYEPQCWSLSWES